MTPVGETWLLDGAVGIAVAAILYAATYLSFVRLLKYPRNWVNLSLAATLPTVGLTLALLVYVSISSEGVDVVALAVLAGFLAALFYTIAAPALAFKPDTSAPIEYLARHADYAGLWMLFPAAIAAYAIPNPKLHGLFAVAALIELAWFLRRRWSRKQRGLLPIQGADLTVLTTQAGGDLQAFAQRHGIYELMHANNEVLWRSCSKTTSPCPLNLYVNRLGLNTAPCCRERMQELCVAVTRWLEELGIVHWLEGGTLLGAVRENGALLAWEDDVDVSVLVDDEQAWRALVTGIIARGASAGLFVDAFRNKGLIAISHAPAQRPPLRWEAYRLRGEVRLDLTAFRPAMSQGEAILERRSHKGHMPTTDSGGYGVPRDLVLPTSTINFLGRQTACPNRASDYLRVLYGNYNEVAYSYVDAGPADARRHLDVSAQSEASEGS